MPSGKSALGIIKKYYPGVTKVLDARQDANIQVTAKDCSAARSKAPNACAMARAFKREYDGAIVSLSVAYLIKGQIAKRYRVPQSVAREIVSFDRHHDFSPGEYCLYAPSKSQRLGPRKYPMREDRSGYGTDKRRSHHTAGIRSL